MLLERSKQSTTIPAAIAHTPWILGIERLRNQARLLAAISEVNILVLMGDVDQLPSVGPGNVLADLIVSGIVPVVTLDKVFGQARRSLIIANAHRINYFFSSIRHDYKITVLYQ